MNIEFCWENLLEKRLDIIQVDIGRYTMIGLRQGDSVSTLLFNLCMEKIIRNVRINQGGTIYNRTRQCLAYADDVVILGRSEGYIKKTLEEMVAITQQIGLQMNDTKTKYMLNRQVGNRVKEIELMGKKYEKVESFKYLGAMITSLNDIETEIKSKIAVGNKCYYALRTILKIKEDRYPSQLKSAFIKQLGTAVAQLLRCCATNRKVAGLIPDGVSEIFL